jgi:hypothetical protein
MVRVSPYVILTPLGLLKGMEILTRVQRQPLPLRRTVAKTRSHHRHRLPDLNPRKADLHWLMSVGVAAVRGA